MFLWVLSLTAFALNLGYGIVFPISEELAKRCGGGGAVTGLEAFTALAIALMSFNLAKVLGEVPGGIVSDRVGDRVVLASSLFIYAVSVIILITARHYVPFTAARFIEGFATGVSYPALTSVLLKHTPQAKLGRNFSIALGSGVAGIVLGPVIAGPLVELHIGSFELAHSIDRPLWLAFFFTVGVFALSVGWFWTAAVRGKRPEIVDLATERRAAAAETFLAAGPAASISHAIERETFVDGVLREWQVILRFAKNPTFLGLMAPLFFDKLIMCAWQVLILAHAPAIGLHGVDGAGKLLALLAGSFAVVTPVSGLLADRYSPRLLTHGSLIGIVATLCAMIFTWTTWTFIPLFALYCVFSATLLTVHLKMVGDIYHEEQQHGRIFGIVHALSDIGMIVGPTLIWVYTALGNTPAGFEPTGKTTWGQIATFLAMAGLGLVTIPAFAFSKGREANLPRP
jgi:MFS family permease